MDGYRESEVVFGLETEAVVEVHVETGGAWKGSDVTVT
jgi:hypothetical protein